MKLPNLVVQWLEAYGVNLDAAKAAIEALADRIGVPDEWKITLTAWFVENTPLSAEKISIIVGLALSEITSPAPGFHKQHGGGA